MEAAALLRLPVSAVRVLAADLADRDLLLARAPIPPADRFAPDLLKKWPMASAPSSTSASPADGIHLPDTARDLVKILVAGPFGVGKTTLIDSVSEIRPLHTEEHLSEASAGVDDLAGVRDKTTTTVAIDFGRVSLAGGVVLYLFGTPGQERFRSLWDDIAYGALGALVLVDSRRIDASFDVLALVEESGLPYAVAFNAFPTHPATTARRSCAGRWTWSRAPRW